MKLLNTTLIIIAASLLPLTPVWAKNLAGFVIVSVGDVTAYDAEKQQERQLKRRSKVFEGDEIRTGDEAKVQLKFKDKGVIALQENTALQISEYEYSGQDGAPEKSFFRLMKGGFRAVSGAIGKQNPEDYRVDTPLATIGIRGTDYTVEQAQYVGVKVHSGAVSVTNSAGEIVIGDGHDFRHALVKSATVLPQGTLNPVKLLKVKPRVKVTEEVEEEEVPELDDAKVLKTQRKAPREPALAMHSDETDPSEKLVDDEKKDKDNDPKDESKTASGSMAGSTSKMEKVFDSLLEESGVITLEENSTLTWDSVVTATDTLDDSGTNYTDRDITNAIDTASGNDTTVVTDPGDTGSTNPDVTDPPTTSTDARITDTVLNEISGHWGIAAIDKQPDPANPQDSSIGGLARDEASGLPGLFVDKMARPDDPDYASLAITDVLRQGTHVNDQTVFARFDSSISTAVSAFSWGRWTGGEARLYTDATDASIYTPITDDIYWFTGSPADMTTVPVSGEARFEHAFLLAGNGSSGPSIEEDGTSIKIGFTVDWLNNTFTEGEIRVVNGVEGDPAQQTHWHFFNMSGTIENSVGDPSPIMNFTTMIGEVCANQCSVPGAAEADIQAFILEGNHQIGGHFLFWETGNPLQWVNGVFAVGEEQRYTTTEAQNLTRAFMGVYHESPFGSILTTESPLMRGKSEVPTAGDFLMVDKLEQPYGAVIRLGSGVVETDNPGGSTSLHGHTVDWGAWNGSSIDTVFTGSPTFATEKYSWISYSPVEPAVMDTLTSEISFSLPYVFYGWQRDSVSGNEVPLTFERGYINADLLNDTLDGAMVFYGTGRFDVTFSGTTFGDGITVQSSSAFFNGAAVNISMDGQYIGSAFADGIAGGFSIGDPGNTDLFATGVYAFGRDERISSTGIPSFTQTAFLSIDETDLSGSAVYAGLATPPSSGIFTFRNFDPVNSAVLSPLTSSPTFNSAMLGSIPVDWGTWDDPVGSAQVQNDALDASSVATLTNAVAWVVGTPSDLADIPSAGTATFATVVGFAGHENALPLSSLSMNMTVDFAGQTFNANMTALASTNSWDMAYNGSLAGNRLTGSGTGTLNSSLPASGVIEGAFVGTGVASPGVGPEGIIGSFKNQLDGNPAIHSSGVFVLQQ